MKYRSNHPSARGFISLGCMGYIIVIALLIGGVQGIYKANKNREPLVISAKDYLAKPPDGEWVTLTGATLNLLESAHRESIGGKIEEVFIPVRAGMDDRGVVKVLLSTKDKETISAMQSISSAGDKGGNEAAVFKALASNASQVFRTRDISGLVRFGIDADSKTRDKLAGLDMQLAKDFIILDEGKKPELGVSIGLFIMGLIGAFIAVKRATRDQNLPPPLPPNLPARG